jgi:5-methylcytosine-specific restriction endonuclease McrA
MKTCSKCNNPQEESCFSWKSISKKLLKAQCKTCDSLYGKTLNKERVSKRNTGNNQNRKLRRLELRKKMLDFLSCRNCLICGEADPVVLEFDHIDPSQKDFSISVGIVKVFSWERILEEINKCQILCANCHRRKTAKDFSYYKSAS